MTGRRIIDTLFPESLEHRRDEIEHAAAMLGIGQMALHAFARGIVYAEEQAKLAQEKGPHHG